MPGGEARSTTPGNPGEGAGTAFSVEGDVPLAPRRRPSRVGALPVRTPPSSSIMRSLLRRLRGALGLGAFGSVASRAFGTVLKSLCFLLHGTPLGLPGSLVPLATGGFVVLRWSNGTAAGPVANPRDAPVS